MSININAYTLGVPDFKKILNCFEHFKRNKQKQAK